MSSNLVISKGTEPNSVAEMNPVSEDLVKQAEIELTESHIDEEGTELIPMYEILPVSVQRVEKLTIEKEEIIAKLEDKEFAIGFEKEMKSAIEENERKIALEIIKLPNYFREEQVNDSMKLLKKWGKKENARVLEGSRELDGRKKKHTKNKTQTYIALAVTAVTCGGGFLLVPLVTKISALVFPFFLFMALWGLFSMFTVFEFKGRDEAIDEKVKELNTSQKQVKEIAKVIRKIR